MASAPRNFDPGSPIKVYDPSEHDKNIPQNKHRSCFNKTNVLGAVAATALVIAGIVALVFGQIAVGLPLIGAGLAIGLLSGGSILSRRNANSTIDGITHKLNMLRTIEGDLNVLIENLRASLENLNSSNPSHAPEEKPFSHYVYLSRATKEDSNHQKMLTHLETSLESLFPAYSGDNTHKTELDTVMQKLTSILNEYRNTVALEKPPNLHDERTVEEALAKLSDQSFKELNEALLRVHLHHTAVYKRQIAYLG